MVSSIVVFDYFFKLRLATTRSVSLSILSLLLVLCRGFVGCWALDCFVLMGNFVVDGIFNVLPGLSLFTLVFICIFTVWLMGACDFCLSFTGFMENKIFNLSLMLFSGRIGDLCNSYFDSEFALLGVVRVGVIDPTCVFVGTTTWDLSPFPNHWWAGAW